MNINDRYYTVQQLADEIGVNHQSVLKRIWDGKIPAQKFGTSWMIERSAVCIEGLKAGVGLLSQRSKQQTEAA